MLFILAPHSTRRPNLMGVRRKWPQRKDPASCARAPNSESLSKSSKPTRIDRTRRKNREHTHTPHHALRVQAPQQDWGHTPHVAPGFQKVARVPSSGDYSQARKGTKPRGLFKRASDSTGAFSRRAFRGEGATANFRAILN